MRRKFSGFMVIASQLFIVGLFLVTSLSEENNVEKHVSIIHNNNLNKIATSVSLLFEAKCKLLWST